MSKEKIIIHKEWNEEMRLWEHLVIQFPHIKCDKCDFPLWLIRFEAYGYPEAKCPICGKYWTYKFENREDIQEVWQKCQN